MPGPIDTTTPADDMLISAFPANERGHRTSVKDLIEEEHNGTSGRHKLKINADSTARAVWEGSPEQGRPNYRQDKKALEIYDGGWKDAIVVPMLLTAQLERVSVSQVRLRPHVGTDIRVSINEEVVLHSGDLTFDMASHLVPVEASSTFYYLYVSGSGATLTPHIDSVAPTAPGGAKPGYHPTNTDWRYIAAVWNNASSDLAFFRAKQHELGRFEMQLIDRAGVVTLPDTFNHATVQDANISALLPATARTALVQQQASIKRMRMHLIDGEKIGDSISLPVTPLVVVYWLNGSPGNDVAPVTQSGWVGVDASRHVGYALTVVSGTPGLTASSHQLGVWGWRD